MKRAQVGDRERRLRGEVRMKVGEVLAAQRNLRVTDGLLQVNRQALGIVQERVKQGAAPALEENLALVEVNRLDASQKLLASRVEVATLQLKALAGMTPDAPLSLGGDLSATVATADRGEAVARALAGRADLEAARADAAASRARILKEQAEGRWDASVNFGYMRQDFGFDLMGSTAQGQTRPIQDVFHYFGGGVSIMLPVRNRNQGNIAAARAEAEAAERRVEFATLTVRQEVEAAFVQYEAGRRWRPRRRGALQPATIAAPPCPGCRGWHPAKRRSAAGRHRTSRWWRCPSRRRQRSARGSRPPSFGAGPRCPPSPFLARSCPTRIATPRSTRSSAASCDRCPSSWARRSRAGSRWRSFSASSWPRRR